MPLGNSSACVPLALPVFGHKRNGALWGRNCGLTTTVGKAELTTLCYIEALGG